MIGIQVKQYNLSKPHQLVYPCHMTWADKKEPVAEFWTQFLVTFLLLDTELEKLSSGEFYKNTVPIVARTLRRTYPSHNTNAISIIPVCRVPWSPFSVKWRSKLYIKHAITIVLSRICLRTMIVHFLNIGVRQKKEVSYQMEIFSHFFKRIQDIGVRPW